MLLSPFHRRGIREQRGFVTSPGSPRWEERGQGAGPGGTGCVLGATEVSGLESESLRAHVATGPRRSSQLRVVGECRMARGHSGDEAIEGHSTVTVSIAK